MFSVRNNKQLYPSLAQILLIQRKLSLLCELVCGKQYGCLTSQFTIWHLPDLNRPLNNPETIKKLNNIVSVCRIRYPSHFNCTFYTTF